MKRTITTLIAGAAFAALASLLSAAPARADSDAQCNAAFATDDYPGTAVYCSAQYQEVALDFSSATYHDLKCVDQVLMGETATEAGWAYNHMQDEEKAYDLAGSARTAMTWVLDNNCPADDNNVARRHLSTLIGDLTGH